VRSRGPARRKRPRRDRAGSKIAFGDGLLPLSRRPRDSREGDRQCGESCRHPNRAHYRGAAGEPATCAHPDSSSSEPPFLILRLPWEKAADDALNKIESVIKGAFKSCSKSASHSVLPLAPRDQWEPLAKGGPQAAAVGRIFLTIGSQWHYRWGLLHRRRDGGLLVQMLCGQQGSSCKRFNP